MIKSMGKPVRNEGLGYKGSRMEEQLFNVALVGLSIVDESEKEQVVLVFLGNG